jgi:hypothetical protein
MTRNALKQTARRSQRTRQRYFFWNQTNVRSAWNRGTSILSSLPRGFLVFQTRFDTWARMPRGRSCWRKALASLPLSAARIFGRLRGLPCLPVLMVTASSSGITCARSFPLAGVMQAANGMPPASVRLWIRIPFPFRPWETPSPPPLSGGKGAINGPVLPLNHPVFSVKAEDLACIAARVPSTCKPWSHRCAALLEAHWGPRGISHQRQPVISTYSNVFTTLPTRGCGMPRRYWVGSGGKMSAKRCHSNVAQTLESACHNPVHPWFKGLWHRIYVSGIDSCDRFTCPIAASCDWRLPGYR